MAEMSQGFHLGMAILIDGTIEIAAGTSHSGTGMERRKRMLVRAEDLSKQVIIKFAALNIKEGIYRPSRPKKLPTSKLLNATTAH